MEIKTESEDKLNKFIDKKYQELRDNHKQNEVEFMQIKNYYSNKVQSFDRSIDRYLDLLRAAHEIAKRIAFETLQKQTLNQGPNIFRMFEPELNVHIKNDYALVIREHQSNIETLQLIQERYSERLGSFHCEIKQYTRELSNDRKTAEGKAKEVILENPWKGNSRMIARFYESSIHFSSTKGSWIYSNEALTQSRKVKIFISLSYPRLILISGSMFVR